MYITRHSSQILVKLKISQQEKILKYQIR